MDEVGSIEWAVATATAAFRACDVSIKRLKAEEREVKTPMMRGRSQ
jgi:hypothetical protein